ncbi:hypothetical protein F1559_004129 [Cyanidiococcus yangmingshanensis]|uniref:Uncharacterized protein n=1 Tax=Cyanidiococcus yangmingshanensis TaxID=2690220 RepID=A0A7J7ILK0_9RHOD|nr:hypothetical protein F1559_004129 [Cyanidiococcus yangmingshanensis]
MKMRRTFQHLRFSGWAGRSSTRRRLATETVDMMLLFDGLVLPPGARYARNLSVIPHTHELEAARVAVYAIPSFLEPVHVYELRPAQVQYKIEGHGTYHTGLSSTETFLVVESARGFDRRALWHPQAWFAYLGSAGLLGVLPWLKARRLFKQIRVRPSRTS